MHTAGPFELLDKFHIYMALDMHIMGTLELASLRRLYLFAQTYPLSSAD